VALATLLATALLADLLANDFPLAVRVDGQTFWLPCFTHPFALRGATQAALAARAEWMVGTPIPYGPNQTFATVLQRSVPAPWAPDSEHLLGTDELGRDVLARLIHGARVSLLIGFGAVLIAVLIGLLLGVVAGYYGGFTDAAISRLVEITFTFPTFFFFIALAAMMRFKSALRSILLETSLSFLGIGVPSPTASWGELLMQAHRYLAHPGAWWLALFPGLAVAGTVLTMNLVGEALQDLQSR
jgi:ABC-type dipeptide/oligopeptide/nickel transport system permease subunit